MVTLTFKFYLGCVSETVICSKVTFSEGIALGVCATSSCDLGFARMFSLTRSETHFSYHKAIMIAALDNFMYLLPLSTGKPILIN